MSQTPHCTATFLAHTNIYTAYNRQAGNNLYELLRRKFNVQKSINHKRMSQSQVNSEKYKVIFYLFRMLVIFFISLECFT